MDTRAAEIVMALQKQEAYRDLQLLLAIPFPKFADRFPPKQKERYQRILEGCTDSVIVCRAYRRPDAYKKEKLLHGGSLGLRHPSMIMTALSEVGQV